MSLVSDAKMGFFHIPPPPLSSQLWLINSLGTSVVLTKSYIYSILPYSFNHMTSTLSSFKTQLQYHLHRKIIANPQSELVISIAFYTSSAS